MSRPAIVWTPNGCPHGPPLPKEGGRYCASCQPQPEHGPPPALPFALEGQADPYLTTPPCASPHAAPVTVEHGIDTPDVRRRKARAR